MRNTLINEIHNRAKHDKNIIFLTWDLGYSVIENFQNELPEQCINIWISEQNMIWIAAWLALSGKKVFCYSIVPFIVMRPYEQIRVDVCYQNLDVTLIWVWWWYAYWNLWWTHHWIEDINLMKWLPNMKILSPADKVEINWSLDYIFNDKWPLYIRLNRWWEKNIHNEDIIFNIQNWININEWKDILILTTWNITQVAIDATKLLENNWLSTKLVSIPLIKPLNQNFILSLIKWKKWIFTIEEHNIIWWLWDSIASLIAENNLNVKFKKFWINDIFYELLWNQEYMRKQAWLDNENIKNEIIKTLNK
jgi:transketolase